MKIQDITEYGSSGPYNQGMTTAQAGNKPLAKPGPGAKKPGISGNSDSEIPKRANSPRPIRSPKDLPKDANKPFGIYDTGRNLIGIATMPSNGKGTPVIINAKTGQPMQARDMLRGLTIDANAMKAMNKESVWAKFMTLPLAEQLRIVEHIDVSKLNRITEQE